MVVGVEGCVNVVTVGVVVVGGVGVVGGVCFVSGLVLVAEGSGHGGWFSGLGAGFDDVGVSDFVAFLCGCPRGFVVVCVSASL